MRRIILKMGKKVMKISMFIVSIEEGRKEIVMTRKKVKIVRS